MEHSENFKKIIQDDSDGFLIRIAHHLVMHASFMNNLGLFHGKMGVVIFFAHLSRYMRNSIYDEYASDLLDEICRELHDRVPIDLENGLCGIGWGVEYLAYHRFIEGDTDDILSEIDKKIMEIDPRRVTNSGFQKGIEGIFFYIQTRLSSTCRSQTKKPFDEVYLSDWSMTIKNQLILDHKQVWTPLLKMRPDGDDITNWKLGIENGCAGVGLSLMQSNSNEIHLSI